MASSETPGSEAWFVKGCGLWLYGLATGTMWEGFLACWHGDRGQAGGCGAGALAGEGDWVRSQPPSSGRLCGGWVRGLWLVGFLSPLLGTQPLVLSPALAG